MQRLYHLVPRQTWDRARGKPYEADSLAAEGFIHCSFAPQVADAANRFYAGQDDLLVLTIDPDKLTSPVREEPAGSGEVFPHVYGPINPEAVVVEEALVRGADGRWQFTP